MNEQMLVCPGCYAQLVDRLGNKAHIGFIALEVLHRKLGWLQRRRCGPALRALRDSLTALSVAKDQLKLCDCDPCTRNCAGAKLLMELLS